MATKRTFCFLCNSYDSYYIKGSYSFYKKSHGECRVKHCIVNSYDSCEFWKSKREHCNRTKQFNLNKLNKLVDNLNELAFIIKENFEEKN